MTPEKLIELQNLLGLSDGKMAKALGITRQTWRNWRRGCKCPVLAQNSIRWMMAVRKLDPENDNLPEQIRIHTG